MKKTETIEEFLARGGNVEHVPYKEPDYKVEPIRSTSTGLPQIMSLDDGAHFFGETRKKKSAGKDSFLKKVENSKLPQHVIDSLTKSIKGKK